MEREEEKAVSELEKDIVIWKESQAMHADDADYFHDSQRQIDRLETELDRITRMENGNGYLQI